MGFIFSKPKKNIRILFLGIERAGKTTILYQLKLGQTVAQLSTVGFNLETLKHNKTTFTIWDVGGKQIIRPLWKHYYENAQAIVYVIDANDETRLQETKEELKKTLKDLDLKGIPLVILANKQDLDSKLSGDELKNYLEIRGMTDRDWEIFETSGTSGRGLYDVLDWISLHVSADK